MPGAISPQGGRLQATRRRLPGAKPQNSVNQPYSLNLNFIFFQTMSFYRKAYSEKFGVWYPEAVIVGQPVPVKTVARRLSQMCTVTYADVMAVLGELPGVMADYMGQGKSVRLDGLGTFRYTLHTKGVADEADFDFQKQLRAVRVQFVPQREGAQTKGSTATRSLVPTGIEWLAYDAALQEEQAGTSPGGTAEPGGEDTGSDGSFG